MKRMKMSQKMANCIDIMHQNGGKVKILLFFILWKSNNKNDSSVGLTLSPWCNDQTTLVMTPWTPVVWICNGDVNMIHGQLICCCVNLGIIGDKKERQLTIKFNIQSLSLDLNYIDCQNLLFLIFLAPQSKYCFLKWNLWLIRRWVEVGFSSESIMCVLCMQGRMMSL